MLHHLCDTHSTFHTKLFYVQAALLSMTFPVWMFTRFGTLQIVKAVYAFALHINPTWNQMPMHVHHFILSFTYGRQVWLSGDELELAARRFRF